MRVLTTSEFLDWHLKTPCKEYIFSSENQIGLSLSGPRASLHFGGMFVCPELRQICFKGSGRDSLFFDRVKEVHMFDDRESIGVVFDIFCDGSEIKPYRILAD